MSFHLSSNSYGKSRVRLTKVVRYQDWHELFEFDVAVQLQGEFTAAYTEGDNRNVIATDTMKNTVYVVAKEKPFDFVEQFALILVGHFLETYHQVSAAEVVIHQSNWSRVHVDGKAHHHAFVNGGTQLRYARANASRGVAATLTGGVRNLQVLKTTGSEWANFHADRYRTLKDAHDRIIATRVDADWTFNRTHVQFFTAYYAITDAIIRTFANQHSLGVQQTLMAMGEAALAACDAIDDISFELPNMHRIPFNLEPFGLKFENDIFVATDEPHGLIKGKVSRNR
jgi:urate oxidase